MKVGEYKTTLAKNDNGIRYLEEQHRQEDEFVTVAVRTSYRELANIVLPDRDGPWRHPIQMILTTHIPAIGIKNAGKAALAYLSADTNDIDVLSVSVGLKDDNIVVVCLVRIYSGIPISPLQVQNAVDNAMPKEQKEEYPVFEPVHPVKKQDAANIAEKEMHAKKVAQQNAILEGSSEQRPFLNQIEQYTPISMPGDSVSEDGVYDLMTKDMQTQLVSTYAAFIDIFESCIRYVTRGEKDVYYDVMRGKARREDFLEWLDSYIIRTYVDTGRLPIEDSPALLRKMDCALFDLYICQDLIDDPMITDIKITDPKAIRVRVMGSAKLSNVTFIDEEDYERFMMGLAVKNNVDLSQPVQTFTDDSDPNYILRFSMTAPYITSTGLPYIHIRKQPRKKMMAPDLIKRGMMDEKIRDYLLDCGKHSTGIVFAGPPGSGKTRILNWFLEEAYPSEKEILVIQENDELFSSKPGIMFEHVVEYPQKGEKACTLEDLGKMALVAGANVFIIGEAKGAEICSAITLANSGCHSALTIHSRSSIETIDKMADLAMRGYATDFATAKRMMKTFQTIVYLQDFQVQEITEIIGYDEDKKDMIYRPIYRRKAGDLWLPET